MVLCRPLTFNLCLFGLDAGQVSRGPAEPDRGQGRREVRHQRRLHREDLAHQQKQIRHRSQFGYFRLFHLYLQPCGCVGTTFNATVA